ncbi:hypothetical protein O3597_04310 [Verrucosispora sp. WMMA2044]|uniref:hypothetical protein n=1 Tax=Verrucosispora sp. WMMA2044 TaxID=3016419 RepID=UPI00248B8A20|nr:hypothetical protein [Verrucosispora sp. WMMA2044]WBB49716.1 hypothetical protein O3597_04310 [Verrucosispora sp. WMMA2044]
MSRTVNAALKAAVDREKRREFAGWLKSGGLPDLTGQAEHQTGRRVSRPAPPTERLSRRPEAATRSR